MFIIRSQQRAHFSQLRVNLIYKYFIANCIHLEQTTSHNRVLLVLFGIIFTNVISTPLVFVSRIFKPKYLFRASIRFWLPHIIQAPYVSSAILHFAGNIWWSRFDWVVNLNTARDGKGNKRRLKQKEEYLQNTNLYSVIVPSQFSLSLWKIRMLRVQARGKIMLLTYWPARGLSDFTSWTSRLLSRFSTEAGNFLRQRYTNYKSYHFPLLDRSSASGFVYEMLNFVNPCMMPSIRDVLFIAIYIHSKWIHSCKMLLKYIQTSIFILRGWIMFPFLSSFHPNSFFSSSECSGLLKLDISLLSTFLVSMARTICTFVCLMNSERIEEML